MIKARKINTRSARLSILLPSTATERRALSRVSPVFFDTYYCGMRYAKHRAKWFQQLDNTWKSATEQGDKGRQLVLAPRDHGKTEAAITYAVRAICLDRNVRILWICESSSQAEKRMRRVKALLRSAKIVADWGSNSTVGRNPVDTNTDLCRQRARKCRPHGDRDWFGGSCNWCSL